MCYDKALVSVFIFTKTHIDVYPVIMIVNDVEISVSFKRRH